MAFNKIQPEQIQLATFFSDSGDLNITQTNTGVRMNVSRNLTGTFNFTGDILTNGKSVFGLANTGNNSFDANSGNLAFLGSNIDIGAGINDHDNVAILANNSSISGISNVILNGEDITFATGTKFNTCVGGDSVTFASTATGNTVLKDYDSASNLTVTNQDSLFISFTNGANFVDGETYHEQAAKFAESGIFSGNLEVFGDIFFHSGVARYETGFALPIWQGNGSQAGTSATPATGALAISGSTLLIQTGFNQWGKVGISSSP
jgi:hypothetical protein